MCVYVFSGQKEARFSTCRWYLSSSTVATCLPLMALIVTTPVRLGKRVWRPWLRDGDRHVDDRDYEREATKRPKTTLDELTGLWSVL